MSVRLNRTAVLFCLLMAASSWEVCADEFVVVVNKENRIDRNSGKRIIKQLYLKERSTWATGVPGKPFARQSDTQAQSIFRKTVLGISDASLTQHWLKLKQKTGQTPPRSLTSDRIALRMVAKYKGAFCVVSKKSAEEAKDDVRILFTLP